MIPPTTRSRPLTTALEYFCLAFFIILTVPLAQATTTSLSIQGSRPHNEVPIIPQNIVQDLGKHLSKDALVVLPSSPAYSSLSRRWQDGGRPTYGVIVVPANEKDVSEAVKYANKHSLPFLATVGGHGTYYGMARMQHGMGIYLRNLTKLEVQKDGKSAIIGGGLRVEDVISGLWEKGKQTLTGTCNCVGATSPALGGGHGFLQGQFGLPADQIISARVVLASGKVITVSEKENKDLYWGLRGAGHNFGIVTEMKYKIYDAVRPEWSYIYFTFQGSQLETLYEVLNKMMVYQPPEAIHWSVWSKNETADPVHPTILNSIIFNGPMSALLAYAKPLIDLPNLGVYPGTTIYPGLAKVAGYTTDGFLCQYKGKLAVWPADVRTYEIPAIRKWYDLFDTMVNTEPALAGSFGLLEGYSTQAVERVPEESTAYALRKERLLLAPIVHYTPTGNATLDSVATAWGAAMREAAQGTQTKRAYVNYAQGNETIQEVYGYEPWRINRLKALKKKYDPKGQFSFFNPIA
ncbi:hypothetical protein V8F33_008517 [Rhypophila sp. PSN 637]